MKSSSLILRADTPDEIQIYFQEFAKFRSYTKAKQDCSPGGLSENRKLDFWGSAQRKEKMKGRV